jgi:Cu/Ag efflux pump CusA
LNWKSRRHHQRIEELLGTESLHIHASEVERLTLALVGLLAGSLIGFAHRDRPIEAILGESPLPPGYRFELLGEHKASSEARSRLLVAALVALLGIALVLHADFRSTRLTLLVMASLPFALVGGIAAIWCTGGVVSLGTLVGLVTVLGIAARNGIMLVSHLRQLEDGGDAFGPQLVIRGAQERVLPILMTALATGLALVPLVWRGLAPGHEIEHPMAVVILGGIVSSTILNLIVLPTLYLQYGRRNQGQAAA